MEDKLEIRREVRRRIKGLTDTEKLSAADKIFSHIEQTEIYSQARCIALYAAMADEVPTAKTLDRWRTRGKRVVVPRVEGDVMRFYDYSPLQMHSGAYGIDEPTGDVECPPSEIELIIVPARAFTPSGARLGRGGGFYDKYMSLRGFKAHKTGVAFACQIFDNLPTSPHDIFVDEVVAY